MEKSRCFLMLFVGSLCGCASVQSADRFERLDEPSVTACEQERVVTLHSYAVGRNWTAGTILLEECPGKVVSDRERINQPELPCVMRGVQPSAEVFNKIFYELPEYRHPMSFPSFVGAINRELAPSSVCYILGTEPLIIGFPKGTHIIQDERFWKRTKSRWAGPSSQSSGLYPRDRRGRFAEFITSEKASQKIDGLAVYQKGVIKLEAAGASGTPATVTLIQFREPCDVARVFEARGDLEELRELIAERTSAQVRLSTQ